MNISAQGRMEIESFEGCRMQSYQDSTGVWTIGYGHTLGVGPGMFCSPSQADTWLTDDLQNAEKFVNTHVKVALTQGEFDALVSFAFNLGNTAEEHSTLLAYVNAGDFTDAAQQFPRWDRAGGNEVAGLLKRRLAEQAEFNATT